MTSHPYSEPSTIDRLVKKVEKHVGTRFDRGENVFPARPIMASFVLNLCMVGDERIAAERAVREATVLELARKGAQAEVYAIREDLGNEAQDTADHVRIVSRDGQPTGASYQPLPGHGRKVIIRASTQPPLDVA